MIISYYTKNTPYEAEINEKLRPSLEKFKLEYDIQGIEDLGSWQKNTGYKCQFIKTMLLKHKKPVVFLDADAVILEYPELLFNIPTEVDLGFHHFNWCYSSDTQVYTQKGWKYFYELTSNDFIYTLNPKNKNLELYKYNNLYKSKYNGKMYNFKNEYINLLVTPEHNMWYFKDDGHINNTKLSCLQAKELYNNQRFKLYRGCEWVGKNSKFFILPSYTNYYGKNKNIKYFRDKVDIPMNLWVKFMGWYLSEGSTDKTTTRIHQKKKENLEEIESIIKDLCNILKCNYSISYNKNGTISFIICCVQLCDYLKKIGISKNKFIPNYIKELNINLLNLFLSCYIKGDGTKHQRGKPSIFTSSKHMLNDLEEIILKTNNSSSIYKKISGFKKPIFEIVLKNNISSIRRQYKSIESYNGDIYCINIKNHLIYVRRFNNGGVWSGNSGHWRNDWSTENEKIELLSGTMYWAYNEKVLALIDEWIIRVNEKINQWEQKTLEKLVYSQKDKLNIYDLPASYCCVLMQDNSVPNYIDKPVIIHTQASRRWKHREKWVR